MALTPLDYFIVDYPNPSNMTSFGPTDLVPLPPSRQVQLYEGDLTSVSGNDSSEFLVVSALPKNYTNCAHSLIGALKSKGVDISALTPVKLKDFVSEVRRFESIVDDVDDVFDLGEKELIYRNRQKQSGRDKGHPFAKAGNSAAFVSRPFKSTRNLRIHRRPRPLPHRRGPERPCAHEASRHGRAKWARKRTPQKTRSRHALRLEAAHIERLGWKPRRILDLL